MFRAHINISSFFDWQPCWGAGFFIVTILKVNSQNFIILGVITSIRQGTYVTEPEVTGKPWLLCHGTESSQKLGSYFLEQDH